MKTYIKLIFGTFIFIGLYSCANSKKAREGAPVAFQYPFYTIEDADSSNDVLVLELFLPLSSPVQPSINLDSVYFRGRSTKLETFSQDPEILVGRFEMQASRANGDRIMSSDPREEYGNRPPVVLQDFPFDLEPNQAMVSYQQEGETKYFKAIGIEKQQPDRD